MPIDFNPDNLIIITGSSGAGKTTVAKELIKRFKGIKKLTTYTTRRKRQGERAGKDYKFVKKSQFEKMLNKGELFEWEKVYGKYYGSAIKDLKQCCKKNKYCLMVIDPKGAKKIKKEIPFARVFFIYAKPKELLERLKDRGNTTKKEIEIRQAQIAREMRLKKYFDYIIENKTGKLKQAVNEIKKLIC